MGRVARESGTAVSAVMFGALAGAGVLPWSRAGCEAAIAGGGKAGQGVRASLAGFAGGFDAAAAGGAVDSAAAAAVQAAPEPAAGLHGEARAVLQAAPAGTDTTRWSPALAALPAAVQATAARGVLRCLDFQGADYATRFLREVEALSRCADGTAAAVAVVEDAARSLALWMCFEDVIRVADLKSRRARFEQVRSEVAVRAGELLCITEMLKPGIEEVAAVLPRRLGEALMRTASRRGWIGRANFGLQLRSTSAWGFVLLRLLASLKPLRPHSLRQAEEDESMAAWGEALRAVLPRSVAHAAVLARLPEVLKGYGDTQRRGRACYARLWVAHVVPALAAPATLADTAKGFAAALEAALSLPPADTSAAVAVTPQPLRFFRSRPGAGAPPGG
jgi:indolepyruvate ferredoxin oxidoreductase beta subunit